jgi:hypothetical protein
MTASNLPKLLYDVDAPNPVVASRLDDLTAELSDRGVSPTPLNIFRFAIESGMSEAEAAAVVALLARHLHLGANFGPNGGTA